MERIKTRNHKCPFCHRHGLIKAEVPKTETAQAGYLVGYQCKNQPACAIQMTVGYYPGATADEAMEAAIEKMTVKPAVSA